MITVFLHYKDGNFEPLGHVRKVKVKENYIEIRQDMEKPRKVYKQLLDCIRIKTGSNYNKILFERG